MLFSALLVQAQRFWWLCCFIHFEVPKHQAQEEQKLIVRYKAFVCLPADGDYVSSYFPRASFGIQGRVHESFVCVPVLRWFPEHSVEVCGLLDQAEAFSWGQKLARTF
jgi:hypothetical protein